MSKTPPTKGKEPPPGLECMVSYDAIDLDSYVEYRTMPSATWHPAKLTKETVLYLRDSQYEKYASDVEKASKDCAAAVRRLVKNGPPTWISEPNAMPLPEGDTHIDQLWLAKENEFVSAKLKDAPEGEARRKLWDAQLEALAAMEAAEAESGEAHRAGGETSPPRG